MRTIIASDGTEFIVSDCDYTFLSRYNWSNDGNGYCRCDDSDTWNGHQTHGKRAHWFIMQLQQITIPKGFHIDHIDRNPLNNIRENLRAASRRLQCQNSSIRKDNTTGYVGVSFKSDCTIHPYQAKIQLPCGKQKYLGCFKTLEEANAAYQVAKLNRDNTEIQKCKDMVKNENCKSF